MLAWHFVGKTLRDDRPVPPDSETLKHDGPLAMCTSGLYASTRMIDALLWAPGGTICRVECEGDIYSSGGKLVCTRRTILWRVEAEELLRDFARWCAWQSINRWAAPDMVRKWLATGDESLLDATRTAAKNAARTAANDAEWAAATATAKAAKAAKDADWNATRVAARDTAWAAARSAARSAAWTAAWTAEWAAEWDAIRAAQNAQLESMVNALHAGTYQKWQAEDE